MKTSTTSTPITPVHSAYAKARAERAQKFLANPLATLVNDYTDAFLGGYYEDLIEVCNNLKPDGSLLLSFIEDARKMHEDPDNYRLLTIFNIIESPLMTTDAILARYHMAQTYEHIFSFTASYLNDLTAKEFQALLDLYIPED